MSAFKGPEGQEDMPYLLTPGPVTTSRGVKFAMLADYGMQDSELVRHVQYIHNRLVKLAHVSESHSCVLLCGTTCHAIDAIFATLLPSRRKKTLVIVNGTESAAAASAIEQLGHTVVRLTYRDTSMPKAADVVKELDVDKSIAQVFVTHCETSSGMLIPLDEIAAGVKAAGRILIVNADTTLGAMNIDAQALGIDVLLSSSGASLASVPGLAIIMVRTDMLQTPAEHTSPVSLDVRHLKILQTERSEFDHLPTHGIVALREALREFDEEGGIEGRSQRYRRNAETLRERLKALGLQLFLPDAEASPIVQTILSPKSATFDFQRFLENLQYRGFAVASGTLPHRASFRVGNIGHVNEQVILEFVKAVEDVLSNMDVRSFAPAES